LKNPQNPKKVQNQVISQQENQIINIADEVKKILTHLVKKLHEKANQK
jgi:hypothetical protein